MARFADTRCRLRERNEEEGKTTCFVSMTLMVDHISDNVATTIQLTDSDVKMRADFERLRDSSQADFPFNVTFLFDRCL